MKKIKYKVKEWDYSFKSMAWWNRTKVKNARIMVVGCGALGNEVIKNLVMMNITNLIIVDFDEIEYSNLSRSIFFDQDNVANSSRKVDAIKHKVASLNPAVNIHAIHADICNGVGLSFFQDVDVIISCVDNRIARLHINKYAFQFSTPWIDGAIENLSGSVKVYRKGETCYECNLSQIERQEMNAKLSCADVIYEHVSQGSIATTSISASIIGAIQVQEALKIIHGYDDVLLKETLYYEGFNNLYLHYNESSQHSDCHCQYPDIRVANSDLTIQDSVQSLFSKIDITQNDSNPIIFLRSPLVTEVECINSHEIYTTFLPKYKLKEFYSQELLVLKQYDKINKEFLFQNKSLGDIGFSKRDIVKFLSSSGTMKYLTLNSKL